MTFSGVSSEPPIPPDSLWAGVGGPLGWDVGANWGQALPLMLEVCYQVVAFEPATESWPMLRTNWGSNSRVKLEYYALSLDDGTTPLSVRDVAIQFGQLVAHNMPDAALPWGKEIQTRTVPAITADSYSRAYGVPDFVRVDNEGAEARVLGGAPGILQLGRTDWLIEFHTPENYSQCCLALRKHAYEIETIQDPRHEPTQHGWIRAAGPKGRIRNQ